MDSGTRLAVDSKALHSFGRRPSEDKREWPDGRRDTDADWGTKTYKGVREDGSAWEKAKRWFGYKMHLVVDADCELPLAYTVTPASANDSPQLPKLFQHLDETHPKLLERTGCRSADKVYDSAEHTVRFELSPEQPDRAAILSKRGITMDDPARYEAVEMVRGRCAGNGRGVAGGVTRSATTPYPGETLPWHSLPGHDSRAGSPCHSAGHVPCRSRRMDVCAMVSECAGAVARFSDDSNHMMENGPMKCLSLLMVVGVMAGCTSMMGANDMQGDQWSVEKAQAWYADHPWLVGCNFIPSTAINQLEMWQADTFDIAAIDRELGWAAGLGFNVVRVYLHDLAYEQDPEGFLNRMDQYLKIADRHGIKTLFVFFDDCWLVNPKAGKQPEPWPGVHNSGWLESPGFPQLERYPADAALRGRLEIYVKAVLTRFSKDERILMWDLYNEPSGWSYERGAAPGDFKRVQTKELCLPLLNDAYAWAREVNPSQPLTTCWFGIEGVRRAGLDKADVVTFHHYGSAEGLTKMVVDLESRADGRPIICTEYLSRGAQSKFETHLPIFLEHGIGAINWGLVAGKTNTIYPWASWDTPGKLPEPDEWFHDIFRRDGSPYDPKETAFVSDITAKGRK
ncbi:MAG: transposase [bacterium]|nr:transposase [bacterium]